MSVDTIEAPTVEETVEQRLVYRVREDRLDEARAIVDKVNRKAAKYGLSGYELVVGEPELVPATRATMLTPIDGTVEVIAGVFTAYYPVELVGEMPRFEGWSFVASLDYSEEGGVITRGVPGVEVDLSEHRARAAECDYCGKRRHRSATYVWRHTDGRTMQVGSTCIVPFAGIRVSGLGWLDGDPFSELGELGDDDREGGGYGSQAAMKLSVEHVLRVTMAVEQVEGWRSRAAASEYGKAATADLVGDYMESRTEHAKAFAAKLRDEADWAAAEAKAAKVRAWAIEQDDTSEWAQNLRQLAGQEMVGWRNVGLLASAVAGYNRAEGLRVEREQRAEAVHVGVPGQKIELVGEVVFTLRMEGYGYRSPDREMLLIRGEVGGQPALIKWIASTVQGYAVGAKVTGTAKVKAHAVYKDDRQTVVTHAKLDPVEE